MQPHETLALSWEKLLLSAVQDPGILHAAYRRFWNYSLGNQLWALFQCQAREIQPGPLASFRRWKELGRSVEGARPVGQERGESSRAPHACHRPEPCRPEH